MRPILPKTVPQPQVKREDTKKNSISKAILFLGILLILTQAIPLSISYVSGFYSSSKGEDFIPVSETFLESLTSISYIDPGSAYFNTITTEYNTRDLDLEYSKKMKINIPSAKINNIQIVPNIPGSNPKYYDAILKNGVAHLKGTAVPGDPGTSVIYGHSGVAGLLANRNTPQIIFSRLDTVSIGDTMSIERDGKKLKYIVSGKKIMQPDNLTFLKDTDTKEKAVLLTCWPLGIGTKRLVIIADRVQ